MHTAQWMHMFYRHAQDCSLESRSVCVMQRVHKAQYIHGHGSLLTQCSALPCKHKLLSGPLAPIQLVVSISQSGSWGEHSWVWKENKLTNFWESWTNSSTRKTLFGDSEVGNVAGSGMKWTGRTENQIPVRVRRQEPAVKGGQGRGSMFGHGSHLPWIDE